MIKQRFIHYYRIILHSMLLILLGLISQSALALSLGEMTVKSHFAEPFLAEISLPSYSADEMGSIEIHLASLKQHEAMGYELSESSKQFRFSVQENAEGKLYIEVRSKSAIKELSISLLIEVNTVNGRLIKGYDILLTPKAISDVREESQTDISSTQSLIKSNILNADDMQLTNAEISLSTPLEESAAGTVKATKVKKLKGGGLEYTNVGSGESLSRIAQQIRPRKEMHMYQVMLALYKENPDAFLNGNINNLKTGTNLKLENIDDITDYSASEARKQVEQYSNPDFSQANEATQSSNRLTISGAEEEMMAPEIMEELHQEQLAEAEEKLKLAREKTKSLEQENKMLTERISMLESKIDQTTKSLFLSQNSAHTASASKPPENTIVMNAETATHANDEDSFFSQYQTSISIAGATFFSLSLIAFGKKEKIRDTIIHMKASRKQKENIFS